jgi:hypothetical protein
MAWRADCGVFPLGIVFALRYSSLPIVFILVLVVPIILVLIELLVVLVLCGLLL